MKKLVILLALLLPGESFSQEQEFNWNDPVYYEQVGPYCDTNKCGRWLTYYPNGEVAMVETFNEQGELTGERVTFRMDGTIKHYTEWRYGYKIGKEIYFDEKGYPTQFIDHMKPTTSICDGEELDTILWEIEQDNKRQNK